MSELERLIKELCPNGVAFKKIKEVYNLRWGIETSFRKLKYTIGLSFYHSYKPDFIKQEIWTLLPCYHVFCDGQHVAEIKKEFTFIFPRYSIEGLGWQIEGQFLAHDYEITQNGSKIVSITKEWMTWGDSYELDITNKKDEIVALAVVLTIDCVTEASSGASVTISNNS